jgi:hypothetical protein
MNNTTANQNGSSSGEKRMEKRDAEEQGSRMPMRRVCERGGREVTTGNVVHRQRSHVAGS